MQRERNEREREKRVRERERETHSMLVFFNIIFIQEIFHSRYISIGNSAQNRYKGGLADNRVGNLEQAAALASRFTATSSAQQSCSRAERATQRAMSTPMEEEQVSVVCHIELVFVNIILTQ